MTAPKRRGRPPRIQQTQPQTLTSPRMEAVLDEVAKSIMTERTESIRPDPRPSMREDDPRARAAKRAAELRDHGSLNEDSTDKYAIPTGYVPDGWDYEWKRKTVLGAEDPSYQVNLARTGWDPVPADRHPDFMPTGWKGGVIERDGLVLMERPKEISDEARRRDQRNARLQVQQKEAQLNSTPEGTLSRTDDSRTRAKISKSYEAIPIPE